MANSNNRSFDPDESYLKIKTDTDDSTLKIKTDPDDDEDDDDNIDKSPFKRPDIKRPDIKRELVFEKEEEESGRAPKVARRDATTDKNSRVASLARRIPGYMAPPSPPTGKGVGSPSAPRDDQSRKKEPGAHHRGDRPGTPPILYPPAFMTSRTAVDGLDPASLTMRRVILARHLLNLKAVLSILLEQVDLLQSALMDVGMRQVDFHAKRIWTTLLTDMIKGLDNTCEQVVRIELHIRSLMTGGKFDILDSQYSEKFFKTVAMLKNSPKVFREVGVSEWTRAFDAIGYIPVASSTDYAEQFWANLCHIAWELARKHLVALVQVTPAERVALRSRTIGGLGGQAGINNDRSQWKLVWADWEFGAEGRKKMCKIITPLLRKCSDALGEPHDMKSKAVKFRPWRIGLAN